MASEIGSAGAKQDSATSTMRVYRGIMRDIEEGKMVPGQRLAETDIAARFGVGRNAVREAMQHLVARGVVDLSRHRSPTIRYLDQEGVLEVLSVAQTLTALTARTAAEHYNRQSHEPFLSSIAENLVLAAEADDAVAFSRARRHFYRALLEIGGNRELQRLFPAISMQIIFAQYQSRQLRQVRVDHYRKIIAAVQSKNGDEADTAGQAHVEYIRHIVQTGSRDVV